MSLEIRRCLGGFEVTHHKTNINYVITLGDMIRLLEPSYQTEMISRGEEASLANPASPIILQQAGSPDAQPSKPQN